MDNANASEVNPPTETSLPGLNPPSTATVEAARSALGTEVPAPELNKFGKPKGKPGRPIKHGKYAKQVPVGQMGGGSVPLLVEDERQAQALPIDFEPATAPFDKQLAGEVAESAIELLRELNAELSYFRVMRKTKDKEFSQLVASEIQVGPAEHRLIKSGAIALAEKHNIDLSKYPEWTLGAGFALWQLKVNRAITDAVAKYLETHPQP